MDERNCQNLRVIENSQEMRGEEVSEKISLTHQTNPIVRKLLHFGKSKYSHKFSVKDLFLC